MSPAPLRRSGVAVVVVPVMAAMLAACAGAPPADTTTAVKRVWPRPPDPPRIAYVRDFSQVDPETRRPGFFRRLLDRLTGRSEAELARMIRPFALFVNNDRTVFVTDTGLQVVHRFDADGGYGQLFHLDNGRRLLSPTGVTQDGQGRVYVSDSQLNRVVVFNAEGVFERELMAEGDAVRVAGVAYHPQRDALYVSDTGGHQLLVYEPNGRKIATLGGRGAEPGRFNFPTHLAIDEAGRVYVTDAMNFRVQVLEPDGTWVRSIGRLGATIGSFSKPKGVGLDRFGNIYVVDGIFDTVQIFNPDGDLLLNFGNAGTNEGAFWLPTGVAIDRENRIYVADTYNARVQVFQLLDASDPAAASRTDPDQQALLEP